MSMCLAHVEMNSRVLRSIMEQSTPKLDASLLNISVQDIELNVLNMRTRMPFRYGIASLESVPHLFLKVTADVDGSHCRGRFRRRSTAEVVY